MTDLADLDVFTPSTETVVPTPRRHRHRWEPIAGVSGIHHVCVAHATPVIRDETAARQGKNNRNRGNSIEREIAAKLGLRRVGQYGGADDIRGLAFAGQVKSGAVFPERLWSWLRAVPVNAGETAILVVTDAPGPGRQRRALVILDLDDWRALHGPESAP